MQVAIWEENLQGIRASCKSCSFKNYSHFACATVAQYLQIVRTNKITKTQ